jgi:hypothetical protein
MTWNADKYFAKAQKYWESVTSMERESEQYWLQVSFFCEFFVRGFLVQLNPIMNSALDEESLLFSAGISANKHRAVDIIVALSRIQRICPEITDDDLSKLRLLIAARNTELHGDGDQLSSLSGSGIMPGVYLLVVKMVNFIGRDLDTILGVADAAQAKNTAGAIIKNRRQRVRNLIDIHKERFFSLAEEEQKRLRLEAKPSYTTAVTKSGHHIKVNKCPACAELGLLIGIPVGKSNPILREDGIVQEVRVQPEVFNCKCCGLEIKGLDELMAANFPHEFVSFDSMDPIEYFSIDPMEYVDIDEIIHEHGRHMDEYQDE